MNVGGLLFACFCFVALLLSCFLLYFGFARLLRNPFLLFGFLLYHSRSFRSIPYHTVRAERERAGPGGNWFRLRSGVCSFFIFDYLSLQIHLHYGAVFVCLLRLWSQSSNARYIVPPHAFGIPSFETFIFAQFQHFSNPRLVEVAGGLLSFFPSFPVWACVEGAVCAGLVVYG
jgi:hypothetical protein